MPKPAGVVCATSHKAAGDVFEQLARRAADYLREAKFHVREFYGHRARAEDLLAGILEIQLRAQVLVGFFAGSFAADGMKDENGRVLLDKGICSGLKQAILFVYSDTPMDGFPATVTANPAGVRSVLGYAPYVALPPQKALEKWVGHYSKPLVRDLEAALLQPLLELLGGYSLKDAHRGAIALWNAIGQDPGTDTRVKLCCQVNLRRLQTWGRANAVLPPRARRRVP